MPALPVTAHVERLSWPLAGHLVLLLAGGVCALGPIVAESTPARLGGALVALAVFALWWRMRHLDLQFDRTGVAFGFGAPRRRIAADRILAAEACDYRPARYMGWGWRIGPAPRERAWSVVGHRRGVHLRYRDEAGRECQVFLSCAKPDEALAALAKP